MSQTITRQRSTSPDTNLHYQDSPGSQTAGCGLKYTPSKIRRIQHSNVEETYEILSMHRTAKQSARWCSINLVLATLCYFELFQYLMLTFFSWKHHVFKYFDFTLVCIFTWNVMTNFYNYCLPTFRPPQMLLTDKQKVLLGITKDNEKLFCGQSRTPPSLEAVSRKPSTPPSLPMKKSPARSLSSSAVLEFSPGCHSPNGSLQFPRQYSPGRNNTPLYSHTNASRFGSIGGTPDYSSYTGGSPLLNHQGTPGSGTPSPSIRGKQLSPGRVSILDDQMLDFGALEQYVRKEEETELRNRRANPESPKAASFWSYGRAAYEYIPTFGSYQLATKSQSPSMKDDDDTLDSPFKTDEMWKKIGLNKKEMDAWTENLRKWLAQTVLEPLVQEITNINNRLTQMGSPELHIGTISHASLQNLATTKSQHLPSLSSLIPYLNVTTNQEYLVTRLKELSTGGCLRLYRWDSGGSYKSKAWNSDLPADAQILIHLFCAYMDTHLPSNPRYPEGRSFSGLHFLKTPSKPSDKKSLLCLYQSRTQKPYFKVLVEDSMIEIPKGRNNLFHSILVFLNHVKQKHHGMLERVNLGMSGINILWVLEKK